MHVSCDVSAPSDQTVLLEVTTFAKLAASVSMSRLLSSSTQEIESFTHGSSECCRLPCVSQVVTTFLFFSFPVGLKSKELRKRFLVFSPFISLGKHYRWSLPIYIIRLQEKIITVIRAEHPKWSKFVTFITASHFATFYNREPDTVSGYGLFLQVKKQNRDKSK